MCPASLSTTCWPLSPNRRPVGRRAMMRRLAAQRAARCISSTLLLLSCHLLLSRPCRFSCLDSAGFPPLFFPHCCPQAGAAHHGPSYARSRPLQDKLLAFTCVCALIASGAYELPRNVVECMCADLKLVETKCVCVCAAGGWGLLFLYACVCMAIGTKAARDARLLWGSLFIMRLLFAYFGVFALRIQALARPSVSQRYVALLVAPLLSYVLPTTQCVHLLQADRVHGHARKTGRRRRDRGGQCHHGQAQGAARLSENVVRAEKIKTRPGVEAAMSLQSRCILHES